MNPYIGHDTQYYGIEEHRLVGGKGDGMRLLQVRNGKGLDFTVAVDLDIIYIFLGTVAGMPHITNHISGSHHAALFQPFCGHKGYFRTCDFYFEWYTDHSGSYGGTGYHSGRGFKSK